MNNQTIHNADNYGVWNFFQNMASQVAGGLVNKLTGNNVGQATPSQTPVYTPAPAPTPASSTLKKWLPWAIGIGIGGIVLAVIASLFRRGK